MIEKALLVVSILVFPGLVVYLESRSKIIRWLSPIVVCYLAGIIIANIPGLEIDSNFIEVFSGIIVGLAIPLLLFNSNITEWIKYAGKSLFSFILACTAVVASSILASKLFANQFPEVWKASGMIIGVYTGGTPNMSAIGIALNAPQELFVLLNSSDVILGALYFTFLITIGKKILGFFLPVFSYNKDTEYVRVRDFAAQKISLRLLYNIIIFLIIAIGIFGLVVSLTVYFRGKIDTPWVLMGVTTLGIGLSMIDRIRNMKGSWESANYLLLVFSMSIGTLADIRELISKSPEVFYFISFVMISSIVIHFALAAIFRIDRDTVIITSTAGIFGPAWIGPVANAIKNDKVIAPGIAMGLLGYAIGNYLGLGVAMLLK
jgi:uncharacterized membrane protein